MTATVTTTSPTPTLIQSAIDGLPIQGRVMLRLLLLQYFDVTPEDIDYMAADRPDPRMQSGMKPSFASFASKEKIQSIVDRTAQYRRWARMRRERAWLEMEILKKLLALNQTQVAIIERALTGTHQLPVDRLQAIKDDARTSLGRPLLRSIEQAWDQDGITEEDYIKERLAIELQALIRRIEREKRQLDVATREYHTVSRTPLQDHEIGHIWGIPAGSLSARKAKYISAFLQTVVKGIGGDEASLRAIDLWKETLISMSKTSVERSLAPYDGLERTEEAFMEKVQAFIWNRLPEEIQTKFWLSMVKGGSTNAVHSELGWSVFGLQRLNALMGDLDLSQDGVEAELFARLAPKPKLPEGQLPESTEDAKPVVGELAAHVLNSFFGDARSSNEVARQ